VVLIGVAATLLGVALLALVRRSLADRVQRGLERRAARGGLTADEGTANALAGGGGVP
jgi:hypothetical protein